MPNAWPSRESRKRLTRSMSSATAMPARSPNAGESRRNACCTNRSADPHAALLAHELLDVIRPAGAASGRSARFPSAERIDAGPRAGRRARTPVRVRHAGLDAVEELLDLAVVLREDAGGQPVFRSVREIDRLVE